MFRESEREGGEGRGEERRDRERKKEGVRVFVYFTSQNLTTTMNTGMQSTKTLSGY